MKLKVFSDISYLLKGAMICQMLHPFWPENNLEDDENNVQLGRLNLYRSRVGSIIEMTSIDLAEFAVFPTPWELCNSSAGHELLKKFIDLCTPFSLKIVVFVGGDLPLKMPFDGLHIFHTSLYRSIRKEKTFAMPAFVEDQLQKYFKGELQVLQKRDVAVVGFCGAAPPLGGSFGRAASVAAAKVLFSYLGLFRFWPTKVGYAIRVRAIAALRKSKKVMSNFIIRNGSPVTWAYGYLMPASEVPIEASRRQFIQNIIESDYVLCARGFGNYSLRLYETLCLGRIPVIIDSDMVLPFESQIEWKDYAIVVPQERVEDTAQIVQVYHNALSSDEFVAMQIKCRKLWDDWLSPHGFFQNFYQHFTKQGR
jgi:hypothetical protein